MNLSNAALVLLTATLLGFACGVMSSFVVLTRRSLAGDAVAHAALPGVCAAFLLSGERDFVVLFIGALLAGLLCLATISIIRRFTIVNQEAAIGIVLSSSFGLGLCLSRIAQNLPLGNKAGLDDFIFGKAASMVRQDLLFVGVVSAFAVLLVAVFFRQLKVWAFDREFARSLGGAQRATEVVFLALLCACTVVGLPAVGAVLMSALLIFPGVSARFWTNELSTMVALGGLFGAVACIAGVLASEHWSSQHLPLPTGPSIVLSALLLFIISLAAGSKRGLLKRIRSGEAL